MYNTKRRYICIGRIRQKSKQKKNLCFIFFVSLDLNTKQILIRKYKSPTVGQIYCRKLVVVIVIVLCYMSRPVLSFLLFIVSYLLLLNVGNYLLLILYPMVIVNLYNRLSMDQVLVMVYYSFFGEKKIYKSLIQFMCALYCFSKY